MNIGSELFEKEVGSGLKRWLRDKWRMFRPTIGKSAEERSESWIKKASEGGFISRIKKKLGFGAEEVVSKSEIFTRFLSKSRMTAYIGQFGARFASALGRISGWLVVRILKAPLTIIRIIRRFPKSGKIVSSFAKRYPEHGIELVGSKTLSMSFGDVLNPLTKLRAKSSAGWASRFKWIFGFVRDMALWTAFDSVISAIFDDDDDKDKGSLSSSDLPNIASQMVSSVRTSAISRLGANVGTFVASAGGKLYNLFSQLAYSDNPDYNTGDVLLAMNFVANAISSQPRSEVLRSHMINILLDPSNMSSSQWLKELLFGIDEEDAEKASSAYLGALRLGVDNYQKSIAEEVVDKDGGMPGMLLGPSLTTLNSSGVWAFDDQFDEDDLKLLSDVDELSSIMFEGDLSKGEFATDRTYDDFRDRMRTLEIAASV
jgi:hypothetical protein